MSCNCFFLYMYFGENSKYMPIVGNVSFTSEEKCQGCPSN